MSNSVTLQGNPVSVAGHFPVAGEQAKPFSLVAKDLSDVTLASFAGQCKILNIFQRLGHFYAIDTIFFDGAFATATCMYLCFDDGKLAAGLRFDLAVSFFGFMYGAAGKTFLHGNIVLL